eukprot:scaffold263086_cov37-Tisochrysis_lutea.AAC.1
MQADVGRAAQRSMSDALRKRIDSVTQCGINANRRLNFPCALSASKSPPMRNGFDFRKSNAAGGSSPALEFRGSKSIRTRTPDPVATYKMRLCESGGVRVHMYDDH